MTRPLTTDVLIVEDDPHQRAAVGRWVAHLGWHPVPVASAEEASDMLSRRPFGAVLLDLRLPGAHGHALLRGINHGPRPLPVIVMSGSSRVKDAVLALRAQAIDYLQKPFTIQELDRALSKAGDPVPPAEEPAPPAVAPQRKVSVPALLDGLLDEIRRGESRVPVLDDRVLNLQAALAREDLSMERIAGELQRDPALAETVLRAANSAAVARGGRVTTHKEACVRLGVQGLVSIAFEVMVRSRLALSQEPYRALLQSWWRHAAATSRFACLLAQQLRGLNPVELRAAGLLRDLGEAACLHRLAQAQAEGAELDVTEALPLIAGVHQQVGLVLAADWGLPAELTRLIGYHHRPARRPEPAVQTRARCVLHAAGVLAHEAGHPGLYSRAEGLDPALARLGLDADVGRDLLRQARTWDLRA